MRKHGACVFLLMALTACSRSDGATGSSAETVVTTVAAQEGKQYRSVCLETAAHGGNQYVLSRWLDVREKAFALGQYHGDFKEKGHQWRLEERVRPEQRIELDPFN